MASQTAPVPAQPPFVRRTTSTGLATDGGPPPAGTPAQAPLQKQAPYLSGARPAPTVGELWPNGETASS
jgi:hypothetical protein